jgi:uncharacterized damage-inducible protein DinB
MAADSASALSLFAYDRWANTRVLRALRAVIAPPARALDVMAHIAATQGGWMGRLEGLGDADTIWPKWKADETMQHLEAEYARWQAYLGAQTADAWEAPIHYANSQGEDFSATLIEIVYHLTHHGAYHRGQVIQQLRGFVPELPNSDFLSWVRAGRG